MLICNDSMKCFKIVISGISLNILNHAYIKAESYNFNNFYCTPTVSHIINGGFVQGRFYVARCP